MIPVFSTVETTVKWDVLLCCWRFMLRWVSWCQSEVFLCGEQLELFNKMCFSSLRSAIFYSISWSWFSSAIIIIIVVAPRTIIMPVEEKKWESVNNSIISHQPTFHLFPNEACYCHLRPHRHHQLLCWHSSFSNICNVSDPLLRFLKEQF